MPREKKAITTSGLIRNALAQAIDRASKGDLSTNDGKNIMGLANAITSNITAELKYQEMQTKLGREVPVIGAMNIGESNE